MLNMNPVLKPVSIFKKKVAISAIGLALLWHSAGWAQQEMPEATGASTSFTIRGFELTGDIPLTTDDTTRVLMPFIGPGRTITTLQNATAALEAEFKAKGFALHRVTLPPQEVGKNVILNVVKFVIGKITLEGQSRLSDANIRASVPELYEGAAPNFNILAIQTTIANENPGKQVQIALKESEEADKIDAKIQVNESKPWNFAVSMSNTGSEATGQDRLALVGGHSNVFDMDQQFSGAYTTSIERIRDVKQLGLNYRIPLYRQGGVLTMSYTNSDVVGSFGDFTSTGAGQTFGLNYSHYLPPAGGRRSYLSLGLDKKIFNITQINNVPVPGLLERSSRPMTLGYNVRVESDTTVWGYNTNLAFNIPGGHGNDLAAYQSEDPLLSKVNWTALRGGVNYATAFAGGWSLSSRSQFQYSPDALISGEQFGLGGASSVRGTSERPIAGDSGLFASMEVSTPPLAPGLRLSSFIDAGVLRNANRGLSSNKPASDQLMSAGIGLRYAAGSFGATLDWGRVLKGSTASSPVGSDSPQRGDQKIHLNLTANF
jgi:hemolysin activation/secretion protein